MSESLYESQTPVDFWFPQPAPHQVAEAKAIEAAAARVEALKILDKDAFQLGDLNPLIHVTDLQRKESVDAVRYTTLQKIQEYGGLLPEVLESTLVFEPNSEKSDQIGRAHV